jgi:hypothetical protein
MESRVPRSKYPIWVKLSMWGVPGRRGLWTFVVFSLACGLASVVYGLWDTRYMLGGILAFAAIPYWLSIQWVDNHGSWQGDEERRVVDVVKPEADGG